MSSFEFNKIFAAVLVAGIVAMLGGFVGEVLVHPHALESDAVAIDGEASDAGGGAAAVAMPEPVLALIASAEVAKGEKISKACAACHTFNKGEPAKVGPNLWGVLGGPKAHMAGFAYSDTLKNIGGTWTYEDISHFLWKPKSLIKGTKMNFAGLKKPEDRAAVIAWLRTMADSPKALPTEAEIAKEAADLAPPAEAAPVPGEENAGTPASKPIEAPADEKIKPADGEEKTPASGH